MITTRWWHWGIATAVLLSAAVISIGIGAAHLSVTEVVRAIGGVGDPTTLTIVRDLRLPRIVLAILAGAGLGMSGAALQGSMRNPLAEPYLLGVSGGAAVGSVLAFAVGTSSDAVVNLSAFAGAIAAVTLAILVARGSGRALRADPRSLLMAGVIIGAFANAVIMVALANAPPNTIRGALWWMMGSAADATWRANAVLAVSVGVCGGALVSLARDIDVLALGADAAASLGVRTEQLGRLVYVIAAALAAATVASAGLVGFVGLVVPHVVRAGGVTRHRSIILGSAIVGGTLVVIADAVARTILPPAELPLGAVTALLGVPFFLVQLRRIR
jgi:iron complex transport system permease protein